MLTSTQQYEQSVISQQITICFIFNEDEDQLEEEQEKDISKMTINQVF